MREEKSSRVKRWVRKEVQALDAYPVALSDGMVKLDAMENPYSLPDDLKQQWGELLKQAQINRYPDPSGENLKEQIAGVFHLPENCGILLGNGSDEIILILAMAMGGNGRCILAPAPSFVMYNMVAKFTGSDFVEVPLTHNFHLDVDTMLPAIKRRKPAVVFIAYPNNPTGNLFDTEAVDAVIRATEGLVVIDEAYFPFCGVSYLDLINEFDNVVVMRTLSKVGLAGLRLGMLFGASEWLHEFNKVRLPYNINVLTQISAGFALRHYEVLKKQARQICAERDRVETVLKQHSSLEVYPSETNFLLVKTQGLDVDRICQGLKKRNVLIKNLHQPQTLLCNCLRVSIGTPRENNAFLDAFAEVLATKSV